VNDIIVQLIGPGLTLIIVFFAKVYLSGYLKEKSVNLATKEDIGDITKIVESTKSEILKLEKVHGAKYGLKYDACLSALEIIDAHLSHALDDRENIIKQTVEIKYARECHNRLLLSCENGMIPDKFLDIIFGRTEGTQVFRPTVHLNILRNLIRDELGFGDKLIMDETKAWLGKLSCAVSK